MIKACPTNSLSSETKPLRLDISRTEKLWASAMRKSVWFCVTICRQCEGISGLLNPQVEPGGLSITGGAAGGRRLQKNLAFASFAALAVLGWYSPGWWVFGVLLLLMGRFSGFHHPAPVDDAAPLPRHSKWLGWLAVLVFILTCMPVPISFT